MPKRTKVNESSSIISVNKDDDSELGESSTETDHELALKQFELELKWCIKRLKHKLAHKDYQSEQQMKDLKFALRVLINNKQPIIFKIQVMRSHFGDYGTKILAGKKKLEKLVTKVKMFEKPVPPKATVIKKSPNVIGKSTMKFSPVTEDTTPNLRVSNINAEAFSAGYPWTSTKKQATKMRKSHIDIDDSMELISYDLLSINEAISPNFRRPSIDAVAISDNYPWSTRNQVTHLSDDSSAGDDTNTFKFGFDFDKMKK